MGHEDAGQWGSQCRDLEVTGRSFQELLATGAARGERKRGREGKAGDTGCLGFCRPGVLFSL